MTALARSCSRKGRNYQTLPTGQIAKPFSNASRASRK